MAQLGSASVLGTGGRRFESYHPDMTLLVQLVERRSPKPDVVGSSPTEREFSNSFFSVSITKYNILVYISSLLFINKITIAYYVFLPILCKIIGFVVDKV